MQAETQKVKDEDRRLQKELAQLQASTHADIERIRMEARESYDRCSARAMRVGLHDDRGPLTKAPYQLSAALDGFVLLRFV